MQQEGDVVVVHMLELHGSQDLSVVDNLGKADKGVAHADSMVLGLEELVAEESSSFALAQLGRLL